MLVKAGQAIVDDTVADFRICSSKPPIPATYTISNLLIFYLDLYLDSLYLDM